MLRPQSSLPNIENAAVLGFSFLKFILKIERTGQTMTTVESVRVVATEHPRLNVNDFAQFHFGFRMFSLSVQHKAQSGARRQGLRIFSAKNLFLNSDNVSHFGFPGGGL